MIKIRLIPTLLLQNGRCIKTKQFDIKNARDTGDPVKSAKIYDAQGADELIFLDISASTKKRDILYDIVKSVADECFMPLTIGGGIRNINDIKNILKIGADKIAMGTVILDNLNLITKAANIFGSSTIIGIINFRKINNKYFAFKDGGTKKTNWEVVDLAKEMEKRGIGEIFLYSIDKDGEMTGYDLKIIKKVSETISVPVICCGGAGNIDDFIKAIQIGKAQAVSAASIFHFTDQNLIKTRAHMKNAGLNVRSV